MKRVIIIISITPKMRWHFYAKIIMKINFSKLFIKQYKRCNAKTQEKIDTHIELFVHHPGARKLRRHALAGEWSGYHSISAGGNLRVHFRVIDNETILFVAVGTHSQLYK